MPSSLGGLYPLVQASPLGVTYHLRSSIQLVGDAVGSYVSQMVGAGECFVEDVVPLLDLPPLPDLLLVPEEVEDPLVVPLEYLLDPPVEDLSVYLLLPDFLVPDVPDLLVEDFPEPFLVDPPDFLVEPPDFLVEPPDFLVEPPDFLVEPPDFLVEPPVVPFVPLVPFLEYPLEQNNFCN